jgi:hypothetical protein
MATGAATEVTKWLKSLESGSRLGEPPRTRLRRQPRAETAGSFRRISDAGGTAGKRGQRAIARLGPRLPHGAIVEAPALERMPGWNRTRRPATPADQRMGCGWLRTPRQRRPSSINTGDRCSFIRELPAGRAEVSGANGQQGCHRRANILKINLTLGRRVRSSLALYRVVRGTL